MNNFFILVFATFVSTASLAGTTATQEWGLKNPPGIFVSEVASVCLTSPTAKVETTPNGLRVTDEAACIEEIRGMSIKWDLHPELEIAAINSGTSAAAKTLHSELKKKADLKDLNETGQLGWGKACPCLAFIGGSAKKLAALGRKLIALRK